MHQHIYLNQAKSKGIDSKFRALYGMCGYPGPCKGIFVSTYRAKLVMPSHFSKTFCTNSLLR